MNAPIRQQQFPSLPTDLADVALIDVRTCAAAAGMSVTSFYELVRRGEAPAPAIKKPRFTRWRIAAVRVWLLEYVSSFSTNVSV
jgi:predicted DNA-binding transcriptional regulator AlpA